MICEHPVPMMFGPFTDPGATRPIYVEWCRVCGAVSVVGREINGERVWTVPVPQTKEQLRAFVLRGFGGVLQSMGRFLAGKANDPR